MNSDDSTFRSSITGQNDNAGLSAIPALTILWHAELERIGEVAPLLMPRNGDTAVLFKRDSPSFAPAGFAAGRPIDHRCISREPTFVLRAAGHGYDLVAGQSSTTVLVDGRPLQGTRTVTGQDLRAGLIIVVGRSLVLCLHSLRFPLVRSPAGSLLGVGDAIEQVRRDIRRAASQDLAVLIRGETGTGKELVARALHDQSPRSAGPFIAVNMATIRAERATADLFGHEKGAFTGATEARPGLFRSAHGGTLFLDEVAATPPDVRQMLLRVLQERTIQPVGASSSRPVDIRVVAATDARLEEEMLAGTFPLPLYYRLAGIGIDLPPLRARREDFGVLFVHFLRAALTKVGAIHRLETPDSNEPAWLPSRLLGDLARSSWPGNVRQLQNLAGQLASWNPRANPDRTVEEVLKPFLSEDPATPVAPSLLPSRALSRDQLLVALERAEWNQTHAAKDLGISRETLRKLLAKDPQIRRMIEIPFDDLVDERRQCGGDLSELGRRLGVDATVLRRRLGAPG